MHRRPPCMVPSRSTEGGGQECLYILHPEEPESQAQLTPSQGQDSDHNTVQSDGSVRLGQQAEVHQENRVTVEECDSQGQEGVAWVSPEACLSLERSQEGSQGQN